MQKPQPTDDIRIPCLHQCPEGNPCTCAGEKTHKLHICANEDCACHSKQRYSILEDLSDEQVDAFLLSYLKRLALDALNGNHEAIEALDEVFSLWETHLKAEQREKIKRYRQEMLESEA